MIDIVPSLTLQDLVAKSVTGGVRHHLQIAHLEAFAASHLGLLGQGIGVGHVSHLGLLGLVGAKRLLRFGAESTRTWILTLLG